MASVIQCGQIPCQTPSSESVACGRIHCNPAITCGLLPCDWEGAAASIVWSDSLSLDA